MPVQESEGTHAANALPTGPNPLREASVRFRLVFEGAQIGVALVDRTGAWILVNPALCRLLGYSEDALLARSIAEITHPDDLQAGSQVAAQALADGRDSYSYDKRYLHADGHVVPVRVVSSVVRDEQGHVLYIVVQIVDQTEATSAAAALAREVDTVRLLNRVAVAANEAIEPTAAFTTALAAVCDYTGWPVARVRAVATAGCRVDPEHEIWHSALGPEPMQIVFASPVLIGSETVAMMEFFAPEGVEAEAHVASVMESVGTQLGRVIERDRIVIERQTLDLARARFVANAAHELRTPLATMRSIASLMANRREDMTAEQFDECLEMLERQGHALDALVTDLLDLSRIEFGERRFEPEEVRLAEVVERALVTAPVPLGTELTVELERGLSFLGNPDRCTRVLVNLLINAYRHGGRAVTLSAAREASQVVVEVADNGDGVPADIIETLFEPFTRAPARDDSARDDSEGAGLGLAITRRIVEAMDGTVEYRPREPTGARFVVRLPGSS